MPRRKRAPAPLRLVVDANTLFAALLRDGTTRGLLLHGGLDLHTPASIWEEFERNRAYLLKKSRATGGAFDLLVDSLRSRISDIPLEAIRPHLAEALRRVGPNQDLDAPYVAAALAIGARLWSHDRRLGERAGVEIVTTADLVAATEE